MKKLKQYFRRFLCFISGGHTQVIDVKVHRDKEGHVTATSNKRTTCIDCETDITHYRNY